MRHTESIRPSRLVLGAALAVALVAGCADKECETQADCPSGQRCDGEGSCYAVGPAPPSGPIRDAGFRDSGPDAGLRDLGVDPEPRDAGDAGSVAGRDGGPPAPVDGGPDAGFTPSPSSRGFVWAGELRANGQSAFVTYGVLEDRSTATYDTRTSVIPDFEGGECRLYVDRLMSGSPTGYVADSITVATGGIMAPPSIAYFPVGNGRFEPPSPPPPLLYEGSRAVLFGIVASPAAGSVQSTGFSTTEAPPIVFEQLPPEGASVIVAGGPTVSWVPSGIQGASITVELYDADREVVLSCKSPDDGSYAMPLTGAVAFMGEVPTRPWTLEIRHDREATTTAYAGTRSFEVTYRASWGARFGAL